MLHISTRLEAEPARGFQNKSSCDFQNKIKKKDGWKDVHVHRFAQRPFIF